MSGTQLQKKKNSLYITELDFARGTARRAEQRCCRHRSVWKKSKLVWKWTDLLLNCVHAWRIHQYPLDLGFFFFFFCCCSQILNAEIHADISSRSFTISNTSRDTTWTNPQLNAVTQTAPSAVKSKADIWNRPLHYGSAFWFPLMFSLANKFYQTDLMGLVWIPCTLREDMSSGVGVSVTLVSV